MKDGQVNLGAKLVMMFLAESIALAYPEEGNEDDRGSGNKTLWGETERTGHV